MTLPRSTFVNSAMAGRRAVDPRKSCVKCSGPAQNESWSLSSIRDLARHLNISIGTVSRALNGRADVNAETRRRVLEAARILNYAPNQSGRSLRQGTTNMVA